MRSRPSNAIVRLTLAASRHPVTAVVANYQGERLLGDCLDSLAAQTLPPARVIVVDGASRDDSRPLAAARGAEVISTQNRGVGHLYNLGAEAAETEFVLLCNNDVAFDARCVELLADALAADERRFAADPTQLDWAGERVIHARSRLRRGRLLREPLPGFVLDQLVPADGVSPTLLANGAAMLVRRSRLLELRFDESFFMEWEEVDLCWRAWLRGWPSVYVPEAVVRHGVGGSTTPAIRPRRLRSAHHNLVRFALKCFPPRAAARVVLGELLRLPRHPLLIAPALARVLVELPEIARERREARPSREVFAQLSRE